MQLFNADATMFSKKNFAPVNMKKPTLKVAHNLPKKISVLAKLPKNRIYEVIVFPKMPINYALEVC